MDANHIEVVSPIAQREISERRLAHRGSELHGKTVGLLDNSKPNADKFLEYVADLLKKEYAGIKILPRRKTTRTEADCLPELLEKCDAVVTAFAD
jgi:hypothetical protein